MTTFTTASPFGRTTDTGRQGPLRRAMTSIRIWHTNRMARIALRELSDHELNDIGLTRGDIERL